MVLERCLCRSLKTLKDLKKFFTRVHCPTFEQLGPEIHANSTRCFCFACLFCYVKTVDLPVSDHGGLFVKEALFLEENLLSLLFRREVTICVCSVVSCCHSNFFVCTDRRPKRSTIVGLQEV